MTTGGRYGHDSRQLTRSGFSGACFGRVPADGRIEIAVSKGLGAAVTAIVSTVANRADDQGFMNNLADLAAKSAAGSHPLDAIGALGPSPAGIDTTTAIGGWLSSLFGHNLSEVTTASPGMRESADRRPHRYSQSPRRWRWDTSGAWCEATSSPSPAWPTCSGENAPSSRGRCQPASECRESARRTRRVGRPSRDRAATGWSVPLMALLGALGIGGLIWAARQQPVDVARVDIVEVDPLSSKAVGTTGTLPGMSREHCLAT